MNPRSFFLGSHGLSITKSRIAVVPTLVESAEKRCFPRPPPPTFLTSLWVCKVAAGYQFSFDTMLLFQHLHLIGHKECLADISREIVMNKFGNKLSMLNMLLCRPV